jgi:hypothetical protein
VTIGLKLAAVKPLLKHEHGGPDSRGNFAGVRSRPDVVGGGYAVQIAHCNRFADRGPVRTKLSPAAISRGKDLYGKAGAC